MNKERLFRVIGQVDDRVIERYYEMDARLARRQSAKRKRVRVLAIAACLALVIALGLPLAALSHPVGRAVLHGDSEALTEQLNHIEGFKPWQEQTAEKLEQVLPTPIWELMQTTPIMNVLTQSQYPDYALKNMTFSPGAASKTEPEILAYYLDDKTGHFSVEKMIHAAPEKYEDDTAPARFVLEHEGASYELRYAYSQGQSLAHQAVHVYELHNEEKLYTAYLDVNAGTCIYWSSPERSATSQESVSEEVMTQRAYAMLADCVRDPEAYELLTHTENGTFICEYTRGFRSTFVPVANNPVNLWIPSCDRAVFVFDGAGKMVSFDLAYLGALRNAEKQIPDGFYDFAESYFRSTFRGKDELVSDVHDTAYVVVITPDGGLALKHEFALDLARGETAAMGYIVPFFAGVSGDFYEIEPVQGGLRVMTKKVSYTQQNGKTAIYEYEYDANGNLIGETMILDDTENMRVTYVYDALGREIERKSVSEKAPAAGGSLKSIYDEQGRLIKQEHYDYRGKKDDETVFEYDEQGRVIREENSRSVMTYMYGENDSFLLFTESKGDLYTVQKVEYLFDAAGNQIAQRIYDGDTVTSETVYEYNEKNQQIGWALYVDGELTAYNQTEICNGKEGRTLCYRDGALAGINTPYYNQFGECISEEYVDADGKLIQSVAYEYDDIHP